MKDYEQINKQEMKETRIKRKGENEWKENITTERNYKKDRRIR